MHSMPYVPLPRQVSPASSSGSSSGGSIATPALLDVARTVDSFLGISRSITASLPAVCGDLLSQKFGKPFMDPLSFERNLMALPEESLGFLDNWNLARVSEMFDIKGLPEDVPWFIYRCPPIHLYLHGIMLSQKMQVILDVSRAFTEAFGWTKERLETHEIQPQTIVHPDDITVVMQNIGIACSAPSTPELPRRLPPSMIAALAGLPSIPSFRLHVRVMLANGAFVPCRIIHLNVRSPNLCPIYGMGVFPGGLE